MPRRTALVLRPGDCVLECISGAARHGKTRPREASHPSPDRPALESAGRRSAPAAVRRDGVRPFGGRPLDSFLQQRAAVALSDLRRPRFRESGSGPILPGGRERLGEEGASASSLGRVGGVRPRRKPEPSRVPRRRPGDREPPPAGHGAGARGPSDGGVRRGEGESSLRDPGRTQSSGDDRGWLSGECGGTFAGAEDSGARPARAEAGGGVGLRGTLGRSLSPFSPPFGTAQACSRVNRLSSSRCCLQISSGMRSP